ncbi:MAG TPA: lysophospholipid acyltransferase family protein [Solirubrobacteraceae bacterium]|jgi:1-acyl-sn-glycerol-3-phosphate acyltransferase|nr:lysophospholipid acyltransferase family protein [Solirubrobacteraceae bacterium]
MGRSPRQTALAPLSPVVEAYLRMAAAVGEDLASAALSSGRQDPLDLRDPRYIEQTLPALRLMSTLYFRASVAGLENIPPEGPVLLVGNHSGGTWIADTFVFAQSFYDHFGADRRFHQLAHDLVFKFVGLRALAQRYGTVPASPDAMKTALDRGSALLVYPGGDEETYRPSWESDKIDLAQRTGFVALALKHGVPIVPVVAIGGQETALFLGRGRRLARWLRLDRTLRLKVFPPALGPPALLTILDLPIRFPLPAKISIEVLEPIDLREQLGPSPDIEEGYRAVTSVMQETLTKLGGERTLPVLG